MHWTTSSYKTRGMPRPLDPKVYCGKPNRDHPGLSFPLHGSPENLRQTEMPPPAIKAPQTCYGHMLMSSIRL